VIRRAVTRHANRADAGRDSQRRYLPANLKVNGLLDSREVRARSFGLLRPSGLAWGIQFL
jgi:hypothetical protein